MEPSDPCPWALACRAGRELSDWHLVVVSCVRFSLSVHMAASLLDPRLRGRWRRSSGVVLLSWLGKHEWGLIFASVAVRLSRDEYRNRRGSSSTRPEIVALEAKIGSSSAFVSSGHLGFVLGVFWGRTGRPMSVARSPELID